MGPLLSNMRDRVQLHSVGAEDRQDFRVHGQTAAARTVVRGRRATVEALVTEGSRLLRIRPGRDHAQHEPLFHCRVAGPTHDFHRLCRRLFSARQLSHPKVLSSREGERRASFASGLLTTRVLSSIRLTSRATRTFPKTKRAAPASNKPPTSSPCPFRSPSRTWPLSA